MPYAQINLAVDVLLIVILSFTLLPKYPKFILALFALYFIPWIFPLPVKEKKPAPVPVKMAETLPSPNQAGGGNPAYDLSSGIQVYADPSAGPREKLGKTEELYRQLFRILGAATGTAPAPNAPDLKVLDAFRTDGQTTRLGTAMEDLKVNPDAAWFYLRLFWLTAALLLWVQNYLIGALALIPSMVPIFYLARALPLAYETLRKQPWMEKASQTVTDEQAGQALAAQYSLVFAAVLIALPTFLLVLLFWRQIKGIVGKSLKKFLQPDLYQVRFNGHLMDFSRDGKDLVIEGLRFKAGRMVQDRKRPEVWTLGSGTVIEFVPRNSGPFAP